MAAQPFKILAFAGSLRAHSYNRGLIRIAQEVAPEGVDVHSFDISSIPLYNEDVEKQGDVTNGRPFDDEGNLKEGEEQVKEHVPEVVTALAAWAGSLSA